MSKRQLNNKHNDYQHQEIKNYLSSIIDSYTIKTKQNKRINECYFMLCYVMLCYVMLCYLIYR